MSNVLVIAAHPDDEILGVGGTVKKHTLKGDDVYCVILGEGQASRFDKDSSISKKMIEDLHTDTINAIKTVGYRDVEFYSLPDNRFDSVDLLDIIKIIEQIITRIKPEIIYTHHFGDRNVDHRLTYEAVLTACRPCVFEHVKKILLFETPSSTEWDFTYRHNSFNPNVFIDISSTIDFKLDAMAYYKTELKEYPHPRSLKALKVVAQKRGITVNKEYAEAFELIRSVE